jgi:serine/threonine protein kinase
VKPRVARRALNAVSQTAGPADRRHLTTVARRRGQALTTAAVSFTPPVVGFLLDRGLLDVRSIVDGDLSVVDATRRNRNIKVFRSGGPCYLVKQGIDAEGRKTVAHEAAVYELLRQSSDERSITQHLPQVFDFDLETGTLVLELFDPASDLGLHHSRLGRFPIGLATDLACALAYLHRIPPPVTAGTRRSPAGPAWSLFVHRPPLRRYWEMSSATVTLIRILQQFEELGRMLDELLANWRIESLIHNDLKSQNCIVLKGRRRRHRIKIVDWEFAGPGDPCWDVGSVFASYLSTWLLSVPMLGSEFDTRNLALARLPLERMQPAIRAFWAAYVTERRLESEQAPTELARAVSYSGARLLQTAYEHTQSAQEMSAEIVGLVQLALNVMARPWEACGGLLGIPLPSLAS